MALKTYRDALREALREEMIRDERVLNVGREVGVWGGPYASTRGLLDEFGEKRVIDTPIAEEAIVGAAIGAAMGGLRPVAELMTINFSLVAMDQIVNNMAKIRFMFGAENPVMFVERARLYGTKGEVPEDEYTLPMGVPDIKRAGRDVTIVTYSRMVNVALEAAETLARAGIGCEAVDLRTLRPLNLAAVYGAGGKTHRAIT